MSARVLVCALLLVGCKKPPPPAPAAVDASVPVAEKAVPTTGRATRGDPAEYARLNAPVIAEFAKDCGFQPVIPDEDMDRIFYIPECKVPGNPWGLTACDNTSITCQLACTPGCETCGTACTGTCTDCKAKCAHVADAGGCVTDCAVERQHCRHDCWDALSACRQVCSRIAEECRARPKPPPTDCPDCEQIRSCLKMGSASCRRIYPDNAIECFTSCAP